MRDGLPQNWVLSTIGKCFSDFRNGTTATQNAVGKGFAVSRIETIQNNRFDMNRIQHIESLSEEAIGKFRYQIGDIAFSHINSLEHVGKTALYEGQPTVFIHGMNLLRLRLGHDWIEPHFAYLFMQTKFFREEVRQRVGHAVNQVSINQKNLADVPFVIAPVPEQRRIVAKLEKVLEKVDTCQKRLEKIPILLKRFRQSVLAAACSGRLTADWRIEKNITDNSSEVTVDQVAEYVGGFAFKSPTFLKKGVSQVIRIGNVKPFALDLGTSPVFIPLEVAQKAERFRLQPFDIVLSMTGTKYKHDYGFAAIVPEQQTNLFLNQRVGRLRCKKNVIPLFLLYWLQSDLFRNFFFSGETGNVNQGNVGADGIRKAPLLLPSIDEQFEIVRRVQNFLTLADQIEARYKNGQAHVDKLTQSILAKAFRGELVPQDPNDEPASLLLQKMKMKDEIQNPKKTLSR